MQGPRTKDRFVIVSEVEIVLVATVLALFLLGHELSIRLWRLEADDALEPLEKICSAGVIGCALWMGSIWLFALTGILTTSALVARTIVAAGAGTWLHLQRRRTSGAVTAAVAPLVALAIVLIALWVTFVLWRGWVVPPLTHDALAYHLPKAVLFARARGYEYLQQLDPITRKLPANYELMLSDVLLTTGSDKATEWISTIFFVLFIVAAVALAQRWWKAHAAADAATAILIAAAPVLLLHSGTHKNDLMVGFFLTAALLWCGRVAGEKSFAAAILLVLSLGLAVGTKPQAGIFAVAAVIAAAFSLLRLPLRRLAAVVALGLVALAFLGAAVYAINVINETAIAGPPRTQFVKTITYGDWSNLWQAPWVLIAAPLSTSAHQLYVPWEEAPWFWRRYEIYFSHLGIAFSLAALLLPIAVIAFRSAGRARERAIATAVCLVTFIAMLPVVSLPHGMYTISLPRYVLFIVPIVFGWTIAPALRRLPPRAGVAAVTMIAIVFVYTAVDVAVRDAFAPLRYVAWAYRNPGTRVVPFDPNRAASIVDRAAGPRERVAVYAAFGTWLHPAFGRDLQRPVELIPAQSAAPVMSDHAKWLVIDRAVDNVWNHPDFKDLSQVRRFIARGPVLPESERFIRAALARPDLEPIYVDLRRGQAVFRRIGK